MRCGGLILCGGASSRIGSDKASLPFGKETMVGRVARIVGSIAEPVVIVARRDQTLPALPAGSEIVHDRQENRGPLAGLQAGLEFLRGKSLTWAFTCGCDMPLLNPEVIARLLSLANEEEYEAVVPVVDTAPQPLAAVYSTSVLTTIERLLNEGSPGPIALVRAVRTRLVPADKFRDIDPLLESFLNVNDAGAYQAALQAAGLIGASNPGSESNE